MNRTKQARTVRVALTPRDANDIVSALYAAAVAVEDPEEADELLDLADRVRAALKAAS